MKLGTFTRGFVAAFALGTGTVLAGCGGDTPAPVVSPSASPVVSASPAVTPSPEPSPSADPSPVVSPSPVASPSPVPSPTPSPASVDAYTRLSFVNVDHATADLSHYHKDGSRIPPGEGTSAIWNPIGNYLRLDCYGVFGDKMRQIRIEMSKFAPGKYAVIGDDVDVAYFEQPSASFWAGDPTMPEAWYDSEPYYGGEIPPGDPVPVVDMGSIEIVELNDHQVIVRLDNVLFRRIPYPNIPQNSFRVTGEMKCKPVVMPQLP